jgi:hypothetical protein
MEISTKTACGMSYKDPLGDDFYFLLDEKLEVLGTALISAFEKSRDLSSTPEEMREFTENAPDMMSGKFREWYDSHHQKWLNNNHSRRLFEKELVEQRSSEWIDFVSKKYWYKNKKAMFKNMQSCSAEMDAKTIVVSPWKHDNLEGWDGMDKSFDLIIPSSSHPEVIGAAVRYSIARCTGKGADLVAKKLFPNGVPDTFEDYLQSLNLEVLQ